jgi:hypothetical protein
MSNICPTKFADFRRAWRRYQMFEGTGAGHIASPTNPKKMLYIRALKDIRIMLEQDPCLLEAVTEVEYFEDLFKDDFIK